MPTFCRHGRFLERCPICSRTLPGSTSGGKSAGTGSQRRPGSSPSARTAGRRGARAESVRVLREQRATEDGYRNELLPGLRASADAARLVEELAFSSGRLLALGAQPPGLYGELRAAAERDLEQATWTCFLIAYLCPLQDDAEDPFAGIRLALSTDRLALDDLSDVPRGPRSSEQQGASGRETLSAYRHWVEQASSQVPAFSGDPEWSEQRRFERLFERLALPGLSRAARYELLVLLGALGLYELRAGSTHFSGARAAAATDPATLAAKRVFAIGDPLLLDRRATTLAEAITVPVESLELALANWGAGTRATLGFSADTRDVGALERGRAVLGL